jgi:osmotically inducible lipoprotein OsmB
VNGAKHFNELKFKTPGFKKNTIPIVAVGAVVAGMLFGLGACSGMSRQDKNTAIGAGVGAVGGAVLTDGSALGTVGGVLRSAALSVTRSTNNS